MQAVEKPSKEQLRAYLHERHKSKEPPPSREEIRRTLGWSLLPHTPVPRDRD